MAMLGHSKWKFIRGTDANSCEIASRLSWCSAVSEWMERGESGEDESRGEDLTVFMAK